MNLVPITSKDDLAYVMQSGVLSLGHHDRKFLENLLLQITINNPITSNQSKLFDLLMRKYRRQLLKIGVKEHILDNVQWKIKVVPSEKKYTEAYIEILDNKIYFRSPYNKKFLDKLRENEDSGFLWDKTLRAQVATFSTNSFKTIVTTSTEVYPFVNFCNVSKKLLESLLEYDKIKYWDPTLVCVNGNYFIAAINRPLYESINHLSLEPTVENLCALAKHGIKVDESITNNDPLLTFASKYTVVFDFVDLDKLIDYLKEMKCEGVKFWGNGLMVHHKKQITTKLLDAQIMQVHDVKENQNNLVTIVSNGARKSVLQHSYYQNLNKRFSKVILLRDSSPILNIK